MKNKRLLLFFVVLGLFSAATCFAHPVTPTFIVERALDSSMFGTALAAQMFLNFLFSPFWGVLCSYVPTKRCLAISCVGYSLGQILFILARTETMVLFARMFAGIFVGGAFISFTNYVINVSADAKQRDQNLTIAVTIQNVTAAAGYFIGGVLGTISTEAAIIAQIVTLFGCGVLFYVVCLDDMEGRTKPAAPMTLKQVNPFAAFVTIRKYMTPALLLIFLIVAISSIGQNSYEQCFNYFIKDQYGMSSAYNGTFKAVIALLTLVLNSTICVYLQKKTDINKTFLYILLACSALIAVILLVQGQILFVAIYIVYSSVNVMRLPLLQSMIAGRASSESRSNLMGFYQAMSSLGGIFGALFAGLIYAANPMLPFILAFAAYAIATVIGVFYRRIH